MHFSTAASLISLAFEGFEVELKNLVSVFNKLLPLLFFVSFQVHSDLLQVLKNLFDSSVMVAFSWVCIKPQNMLHSQLFGAIFEEIPVVRRSECVHEPSLSVVVILGLFVLVAIFLVVVQFVVLNPCLVVLVNQFFDLIRSLSSESLQQDVVFYILQHMVVHMLQHFSGVKPHLLILLIKVTIPHPVSSILLPLCSLFFSLFLLIRKTASTFIVQPLLNNLLVSRNASFFFFFSFFQRHPVSFSFLLSFLGFSGLSELNIAHEHD